MRRIFFGSMLAAVTAIGGLLFESGIADIALAAPKAARKAPEGAAAGPASPSPQIVYLVRSALSTLHDANMTGNYSVLRDLAAPSFQAKHSAADLAEIFAAARRKPIDLGPAAVLQPVVREAARPSPDRLHVVGHIGEPGASAPASVGFALQYEAVNGHWRIAAISVASP